MHEQNMPFSLKSVQTPGMVVGLIGLALAVLGAYLNIDQFWRSYLLDRKSVV